MQQLLQAKQRLDVALQNQVGHWMGQGDQQ
jgi:hypothetical protein